MNNDEKISDRILKDLKDKNKENLDTKFIIKKNTVAEINSFETKKDIINYLIHRYKYEVFPSTKEISEYPPLIQIEPSSICNFRCVFCFETDKTFTNKKMVLWEQCNLKLLKKLSMK